LKGSFWWRDILKLLGKFKSLASVNINLGDTCLLWHDFWNGSLHSQVLHQLFSFARSPFISINNAKAITDVRQLFHLSITQEAYEQLLTLAEDLNALPTSDQQDI
jgi:hypothetical protein